MKSSGIKTEKRSEVDEELNAENVICVGLDELTRTLLQDIHEECLIVGGVETAEDLIKFCIQQAHNELIL